MLRHRCTACGGCCQGVRVPLFNDDEVALARAAGEQLGVVDPIDGAGLRMEHGRCVFLTEDDRCRIHAALGPTAKPIPCQQFPLIAIADGDDVRVGIDPASYGAWQTWRDGPPIPDGPVVAGRLPETSPVERTLVALCEQPDVGTGAVLATLVRESAVPRHLPESFAHRWATHLYDLDFDAFLGREGPGRRLIDALRPLAAASQAWADGAPTLTLPGELDDWIVEATRRVLWLRLLPDIANPTVAALLCLGGGVAASWSSPNPSAAHDAFTAWLRALRFDLFWQGLAKDQATVLWLATGQRID